MHELTEQEAFLCRPFTVNGRAVVVELFAVPGFLGRAMGRMFTARIDGVPMRSGLVASALFVMPGRYLFRTVDEARSAARAACLLNLAAG